MFNRTDRPLHQIYKFPRIILNKIPVVAACGNISSNYGDDAFISIRRRADAWIIYVD